MATKTYSIRPDQKPTEEQLLEIKEATRRPILFDEDSYELTDEELTQFRRIADIRKEERRKQSVTIRLSPKALRKAKALGKGYTSVLSRILEKALDDNDTLRRNL